MTNDKLIEAMAEGIWSEYGSTALFCELDHARKQEIRGKARAAIKAAESAGYRLVPAEATEAMQLAGAQAVRFDTTPINRLWSANAAYRAMLAAAPDHSEQDLKMVPGWVPVSERLPEPGQYPVLVVHRSGAVRLAFGIESFIDGEYMAYYEPSLQGRFLKGITHWMPIPAAPEVDR